METFFSLKNKNHVDMIGHNRIFVDRRIISLRKILNLPLDNLTNREEQSPSPTGVTGPLLRQGAEASGLGGWGPAKSLRSSG